MRAVPSYLHCAILLVATRIVLRLSGLRRARALAYRLAPASAGGNTDAAAARAVADRMAAVAALLPMRVLCLEQSLALLVALRRGGIAAALRIGAQPYPFTAHAWVEVSGEPVNSEPELVRHLVPFPDPAS